MSAKNKNRQDTHRVARQALQARLQREGMSDDEIELRVEELRLRQEDARRLGVGANDLDPALPPCPRCETVEDRTTLAHLVALHAHIYRYEQVHRQLRDELGRTRRLLSKPVSNSDTKEPR